MICFAFDRRRKRQTVKNSIRIIVGWIQRQREIMDFMEETRIGERWATREPERWGKLD